MFGCIVKKEKEINAIYCEKGSIFIRRLEEGLWCEAEEIACNVRGGFTLMRDAYSEPIVLYQNKKGALVMSGSTMKEVSVLESTGEINRNVNIELIRTGEGLRLIYDRVYMNQSFITEQHRGNNMTWSAPEEIDSYEDSAMPRLINVENNNLIFYIKKVPEYQLGYREIYGGGISDFKMLYTTGYKIKDYSLAVTCDEIYISVVIVAGRTNRLVYIKKDMRGISRPVVLSDGIINSCQLAVVHSKPTIAFSTPKGNNILSSYDGGGSFKRVGKSELFPFNKIAFIDYTRQSTDSFVATELVNCSYIPYDIKYCPYIAENTDSRENEIERLKKEIERLKKEKNAQ